MVERIKSTMTYAEIGARVSITADRARELVERGVRNIAHGNAECNLSKDDLETARLRNRLPPWDIGLLEPSCSEHESGAVTPILAASWSVEWCGGGEHAASCNRCSRSGCAIHGHHGSS
jgi:hypothetical protein